MRSCFGILVLAVFSNIVSAPVAKADDYTFAFIFATANGEYVGSGSFEASQYVDTSDPCTDGALCISSLQGQVNGIPMVLAPGLSEMDYSGPLPPVPGVPLTPFSEFTFLTGGIDFTVDGQSFYIFDNDFGAPPFGIVLSTQQELLAFSTFTIIPEPASEPATSFLLVLGFLAIASFGRLSAKSRKVTALT